jgi:hypothetical protein
VGTDSTLAAPPAGTYRAWRELEPEETATITPITTAAASTARAVSRRRRTAAARSRGVTA